MKKISSDTMVLTKIFFPLMWFGYMTYSVVRGATRGVFSENLLLLAVPCSMAVLSFVYMRKFVWALMDEVHDSGEFLLVRKGSEEERIPLEDVVSVRVTHLIDPRRITLRLERPGRFGAKISFLIRKHPSFNPFARNLIAMDLIARVNKARMAHGVSAELRA